MKSRRDFLRAFAVASVGIPVAQKLGFLEEFKKWWFSNKTIISVPAVVGVDVSPWTCSSAEMYILYYNVFYDADKKIWTVGNGNGEPVEAPNLDYRETWVCGDSPNESKITIQKTA